MKTTKEVHTKYVKRKVQMQRSIRAPAFSMQKTRGGDAPADYLQGCHGRGPQARPFP